MINASTLNIISSVNMKFAVKITIKSDSRGTLNKKDINLMKSLCQNMFVFMIGDTFGLIHLR